MPLWHFLRCRSSSSVNTRTTPHSSIFSFRTLRRSLLLLLLILGLSAFGLGWVFEQYIIYGSKATGASKTNRILHETHLNEIPIFGSSRAEGSYVPSILGEDYFNYGIAGTQNERGLALLCNTVDSGAAMMRPRLQCTGCPDFPPEPVAGRIERGFTSVWHVPRSPMYAASAARTR